MPVTNLNKVVGLFLVGSITLLWVVAMWWKTLEPLRELVVGEATIASGIFSGIVLVAVTGLLGIALDGVTDVSVRRYLKRSARDEAIATRLGQRPLFVSLQSWKELCRELVGYHPIYSYAADEKGHTERASFQLAAGIFQRHATKEEFEWVTSHYSTYHLATNCCVILAVFSSLPVKLLALGQATWPIAGSLLMLGVLGTVASAMVAVDRYLYTYLCTFRFVCLWVQEKGSRAPDEGTRTESQVGPVTGHSVDV